MTCPTCAQRISDLESRVRSDAIVEAHLRATIYDDWGTRHIIKAPSGIIETLVTECLINEIPRRKS